MHDEASRPRSAFEQGVALLRDGRYQDALERFDARAQISAPGCSPAGHLCILRQGWADRAH